MQVVITTLCLRGREGAGGVDGPVVPLGQSIQVILLCLGVLGVLDRPCECVALCCVVLCSVLLCCVVPVCFLGSFSRHSQQHYTGDAAGGGRASRHHLDSLAAALGVFLILSPGVFSREAEPILTVP